MLCGCPPFVDKSVLRVLSAQVTQTPRAPSMLRPGMAHATQVDDFVLRALEKRPPQRYQTAREMRAALHALARVLGGLKTVSQRITLPSAEALDRTHPEGTPSAEDLASTLPDSESEAGPPRLAAPPAQPPPLLPAPSTTGVRAHPTGVSTLGVVLAAAIGALIAAVVTYLLVRR